MHKTVQTANRVLRPFTLVLAVSVAVAVTLAASGTAHAKAHGKSHGAAPKVGLLTFTGPGEAASRNAVEKALKSRKIVVVPASDLTAAARSAHVKLDSNDGFKAVAKALDLTAIVSGEVSKKKATITVRTGDDGSVVGEETFQGADPKKVAVTVGKTFWKRLAGAFNKTKHPSGGGFEAPPPEEEPASTGSAEASNESTKADEAPPAESRREKKAEKSEEKSETKTEEKSDKSEKSKTAEESESPPSSGEAVDVSAGPAWFMRSLSFNQPRNDLSNTKVASYSLPRAPALFLRGDIFPGALAGMDGVAGNIGLTVDVSYLLPVVKSSGTGGNYNTSGLAYALGLKARLPLGLFASVSYADQTFKLTKTNSSMADSVVPGTNYKFVRADVGIREQVTPTLMLQANAGYLQCLGKPGDIGSSTYFPRVTCNGAEAGVAAGYRLAPSFELRAGVDWRRFGLNFHVKASDVNNDPSMTPPIAGGAVDQYIQIYAGIAYLIGGGGSESGHAAEPASGDEGDKPAKAAKSEKAEKSDEEGEGASEGGE